MKILIISDFEENYNAGSAGSILIIGDHLAQLGHQVQYIWKNDDRFFKNFNLYRNLELPVVQYKQLKAALSKEHFDVVFISQPFAWMAFRSIKKNYPDTLFLNRTHGWELRIGPFIWDNENKNSFFKYIKNTLTKYMLRINSYQTIKHMDGIVCASSSDSDFIKKEYPAYSDNVFLVNYGLSPEFLNIEKPVDVSTAGRKLRYLFAGQYSERKGILDIKNIFKKIADRQDEFELIFIVNQNSIEKVHQDFDFLTDKSLTVLPWVSRTELIDIYKSCDVFLLPSYGEGFGKTSVEAMACGLCVIGYIEGALKDFGVNNVNALLSEPGDKETLERNIKFALNNPGTCKEIGIKAHESMQHNTWLMNASNTVNVIDKIRTVKNSNK